MRVLIGTSEAAERKRLVALLGSKFDASEAATPAALATQLAAGPAVAVVDAAQIKVVKQAACERVYVIALVPAQPTSTQFWLAYTNGADDVLRTGACKEEVFGRIEARERLRSWAALPATSDDPFTKLVSWQKLEEIVTTELSSLLGVEFASAPSNGNVVAAAELPLVCASHKIELTLGIGIDAASKTMFQNLALGGDTSAEALADGMRELANTAAGAVKRTVMLDGIEFTIGLPRNANPFAQQTGRRWNAAHADLAIACIAVSAASAPSRVLGRQLREGMVLTRDVLNVSGTLLAPGGTYLTRNMAERLGQLLGDIGVEVTDTRQAA
jgi:hypothetical protein